MEPPAVRLAAVTSSPAPAVIEAEPPPPPKPAVPWASALSPLAVRNLNTASEATVRLYSDEGDLDPVALDAFLEVAGDGDGPAPLLSRVVQLAVKAAYHFKAQRIDIISAYRAKRRGKRNGYHAMGAAIDFQLPGIAARTLAAFLRTIPRAGVGVYTHPRTQFVHLDVRDRSFHWLDASPPGVTWQEAMLSDPGRDARDASYTEEGDLPIETKDASPRGLSAHRGTEPVAKTKGGA
jgi:uncharacterized protein YcbK (DUF882 family)